MANAKHSNGRLFRFLTGSPYRIDTQYSVGLRAVTVRAIVQKGGALHADGHSKKAAATLYRAAAAVFPQQKITGSVLADPCVFPHLSSSPDLRFCGSVRPSQVAPMTGFRLARTSTHTVAVPSGILTRLSILLQCCYRSRRHLNGILNYCPVYTITAQKSRRRAQKRCLLFRQLCSIIAEE